MTKTSQVYLTALVLVILLQSTEGFVCTEAMYEDYLAYWSRNFTKQKLSPEFTTKFSTYCTNKEFITTTNSQNLGYELDQYWQWMQMPQEQRTPSSTAATVQPADGQLFTSQAATIPQSKDWRLSNDVSSIKSQGSCGSCWAFAAVGLYESWMMVMGQKEYNLSQEYILECTTLFTKNNLKLNHDSDCRGGSLDFGGSLARVNGIPSQNDFPYVCGTYTFSVHPNTCGICSADETYMYNADPSVTKYYVSSNNTNDQMKQLLSVAPVGALMYSDSGFQAYKSGVYKGCPTSFNTSFSNINHAVVIVGYDSSGNYIVKNSRGTSWGQKGFGVVSKDSDCALSAWVYYYRSTAPLGEEVLYYNQINLGDRPPQ